MLAATLLALQAATTAWSPASLAQLAQRATDSELANAVRAAPQVTRDAVDALLAQAIRDDTAGARALARANSLAGALLAVHGDSFPLLDVARFARWTPRERAARVAIDSLRRAGNAALGAHGVPAAMRLWRQSLRRAEALPDTAGAAKALGNIGSGFLRDERLDSATAAFTRARRLADFVHDTRTALNALGGLANVAEAGGDPARARALLDTTAALRGRIGDVRGLAADHTTRGLLALGMGDGAAARASFGDALSVSQRYGLGEAEGAAHLNLAALAADEARYDDATAHAEQARRHFERLGDRHGQAGATHALGLLALRQGDYANARERLAAAAALYESLDAWDAALAVTGDLARLAAATGDLAAARSALARGPALAARGSLGHGARTELALLRGDVAAEFGRWLEADSAYREAEGAAQRTASPAQLARARLGRALVRLADGDATGAAPLLEGAARQFDLAGDRREAALTRLDLVTALAKGSARAQAARVLAGVRPQLAALDDPVAAAAGTAAAADLELRAGRPAQAERLAREALAALQGRGAPTVEWPVRVLLGDALAAQRSPGAADAYRDAVRLLEATARTAGTRDWQSAYLDDKRDVYARLVRLERDAGRAAEAFAWSERQRARALLDAAAGHGGRALGTDTALVRRELALRQAITDLSRQWQTGGARTLALRGPADPGPAPAVAQEAMQRLEAERAAVLQALRERAPAVAPLVSEVPLDWRAVAAQLPDGAALLEYFLDDSSATLFVVRQRGVHAVDLGADRRTLGSLVAFARGILARPSGPDAANAVLERLYRHLIEPAAAAGHLEGVDRLLLVPHAELHYLPFAALRVPGADGGYLAERYALATAPSAGLWAQRPRTPAGAPGADRILALAPVERALPGTRREVEAIAALAPGATVLTGAAATPESFRRLAPEHGTLHLATYGVLNARHPLFSYVELAGTGARDGRLEVHDVHRLALGGQLVVLSACQTALASSEAADVPPGEDWVGLSQAFLAAGASRVVATLWRIDDAATARLMPAFHRARVGAPDVATALVSAQRAALADPQLRDPYYWAGLTLIGGW